MSSNFIRLGQVATFINGKAFKPDEWAQSGIPIIRIQNLTDNTKEFNYYRWKLDPRYVVTKGDILISWSASLGVFEWNGVDAALNQHIFKVQFNKLDVDKTYFKFIVSQVINEMLKFVHGSTMKHIVKNDFDNTKIPLPPLTDQQRIATILDYTDAIRFKNRLILEKYNELAQSVFYEMFQSPDSKSYKSVTLEEVTNKITDGVHQKPNYTASGIPFISVKDITTGELKFDDCKYISEDDHNKFIKSYKPEYLDVLYTKVGATYGRPALINTSQDFSIYVSVALIKPKKEIIDSFFLKELLKSPMIKKQADKKIKGIGVPDLHLNMIKEFSFPLPPLIVQQKFAMINREILKQIELSQKSLKKSDDLFHSLLQRAFKGEL
jgi:type I restriction enzyme S subunit